MAQGPKPHELYIPSLDGVRAVAFLIVFFSHVGGESFVPGGFGVTVFFFLSGFLITTLLRVEAETRGSISLRQFYLRRALRIFPPMYLALGLAVLVSLVAHAPISAGVVAIQALHLTNYHVALGGRGEPLGMKVLWSLAVEEHFYLVFPLCYLGLLRVLPDPKRQALVLRVVCAAWLAWRCFLVFAEQVPPLYLMHATDCRVDSILFGCVLALSGNPALPGPQGSPGRVWVSFFLALVVLVGSIALRDPVLRETLRYTIQGFALGPVFVAIVRFPNAPLFRPLNWRPVRFLGVLSYSLYLVHDTVAEVARSSFHLENGPLVVVGLGISTLIAVLLHYGVERPCARIRKRLSRLPLVTDGLESRCPDAES